MEKRYLLQAKKAKNGEIKQFVFAWTPILAMKKEMREISIKVAELIMSGQKIPVSSLPDNITESDVVSVHVKKEFFTQVVEFIENLEKKSATKIPASADFPEITIQAKDKTLTAEKTEASIDNAKVSILKREISGIKSKNGLENYIEENKIKVDVKRTDSLYEMKQKIIKEMAKK